MRDRKTSKEVEDLRRQIEPAARRRYGQGWITGLAKAIGVPPKTIHTLFYRGQRLDAQMIREIERQLDLTVTLPGIANQMSAHDVAARYSAARTPKAVVAEALAAFEPLVEEAAPLDRKAVLDHLRTQMTMLAEWAEMKIHARARGTPRGGAPRASS